MTDKLRHLLATPSDSGTCWKQNIRKNYPGVSSVTKPTVNVVIGACIAAVSFASFANV